MLSPELYRYVSPYTVERLVSFTLRWPLPMDGEVDHPLYFAGFLQVVAKKGYAWDGAGSLVARYDSLRATLLIDVLYEVLRHHAGGWSGYQRRRFRRHADREFRFVLAQDGMTLAWRWLWWLRVRLSGIGAGRSR